MDLLRNASAEFPQEMMALNASVNVTITKRDDVPWDHITRSQCKA